MQSPRTTLSLFLSLSLVLDCFTLSRQCSIASLSLDDSADERMPPPPEDEFAALSRALATLRDRHSGAILTDEFLEVCRGVLPVIGELFSPFFVFPLAFLPSSFVSALHPYSARHHLPHPGHFGAALAAIIRSDVGGNIDRLERARRRGKEVATPGEEAAGGGGDAAAAAPSSTASPSAAAAASSSLDPSLRLLFSIPLEEIERGADLGAKSDAKGLLWLKRANDFILLMLENLLRGTKEGGGEEKENETTTKKDASSSSSSSSSAAPPPLKSVSAAAREAYNDTLRKYHGMLTAAAFSAALSVREKERKR